MTTPLYLMKAGLASEIKGDFKVLKNRFGYKNNSTALDDLKNNDIDGYNKVNLFLNNIKNKLRKKKLESL